MFHLFLGYRYAGPLHSLESVTKLPKRGKVGDVIGMISPEEIHGWPVANKERGTMDYLPPATFPRVDIHGPKGILLLDELPRAERAVLDAVFQVVYDGQTGEAVLPPEWIVSACGNPM